MTASRVRSEQHSVLPNGCGLLVPLYGAAERAIRLFAYSVRYGMGSVAVSESPRGGPRARPRALIPSTVIVIVRERYETGSGRRNWPPPAPGRKHRPGPGEDMQAARRNLVR